MFKTTGKTTPHRLRAKAIVAASAAIMLTGCSGIPSTAPSGDSVDDIRLTSTGSVFSLAVWVAQEQGYFEDHDLNVELEITSTQVGAQVPSLLGKQYDIGQVNAPALITAASQGVDVLAVAGGGFSTANDGGTLLIASPESGIKKPEDLIGKRLAAPSVAGNVNTGTMFWLSTQGVDFTAIDVVAASTANMPDLLRTGQIDAAEVTMPHGGELIKDGYTVVQDIGNAVGDPALMITWSAARDWAEANSDLTVRFRVALDEAAVWIKENEQAAVDLLMEKTETPEEYREYMSPATYNTELTPAYFEAWYEAMNVVTGFDSDLAMESLVFDPK